MKEAKKTVPAKDVDEYLASVPEKDRAALSELRRAVRAVAPMAKERISYGMPAFIYHGPLVFFASYKNHLSLFGVSKEILESFKSELGPYRTSGTTLHFTAEHPLPVSLVRKIIRSRIAENEVRNRERGKK
jgi:uncharacterized protein YdhG (YjbR/CyaY superfamily)